MKLVKFYQETIEYFNEIGEHKKGMYDPIGSLPYKAQAKVREKILSLISPDNNSIVDIGCGKGDFSIYLARTFHHNRIYGMDFSEQMIRVAEDEKRNQNVQNVLFIRGTMLALPFPDHCFDSSICMNTFHHIHYCDHVRALDEIARVTKKEIIIEIKNILSPYYVIRDMTHIMRPRLYKRYGTSIYRLETSLCKKGLSLRSAAPLWRLGIVSPIIVAKFIRTSGGERIFVKGIGDITEA